MEFNFDEFIKKEKSKNIKDLNINFIINDNLTPIVKICNESSKPVYLPKQGINSFVQTDLFNLTAKKLNFNSHEEIKVDLSKFMKDKKILLARLQSKETLKIKYKNNIKNYNDKKKFINRFTRRK